MSPIPTPPILRVVIIVIVVAMAASLATVSKTTRAKTALAKHAIVVSCPKVILSPKCIVCKWTTIAISEEHTVVSLVKHPVLSLIKTRVLCQIKLCVLLHEILLNWWLVVLIDDHTRLKTF